MVSFVGILSALLWFRRHHFKKCCRHNPLSSIWLCLRQPLLTGVQKNEESRTRFHRGPASLIPATTTDHRGRSITVGTSRSLPISLFVGEVLHTTVKRRSPQPDLPTLRSDFPTAGLLSRSAAAWPSTGWAARVVRKGLTWPWIRRPPLRRPRATPKVKSSIFAHVQEMYRSGVVERTSGPVFTSRLFTVPKRGSAKDRLVVDLSSLNKFIPHFHFRMLTIAQVRLHLKRGDWLASLDLKDAYWHVPIHPRFRKFLAFRIGKDSFQFTRLPFGLSLAPRVFSRLTKVVASRLATLGVNTLMYLDDWLVVSSSQQVAEQNVATTVATTGEMGFQLNYPKSALTPTQRLCWLGMEWDTSLARVRLSQENASKTRRRIFRAFVSKSMTRRQWEGLLGALNFAAEVVPLGRLRHRRLVREVNAAIPVLPRDLLRPVPRFLSNLLLPWLHTNVLLRWVPWVAPPPSLRVATDASDLGWGYQSSQGHQNHGGWKGRLREAHINIRELHVAYRFLLVHKDIRDIGIAFEMDSVAAVYCINRQGTSRSEDLLSLSEKIFREAHSRSLLLSAVHVPGVQNSWADALSRFRGTSVEWQLCPKVFRSLLDRWGSPEVDLFASPSTALLPHYLARDIRTPTGGPDAFSEDWNRWRYIYLFPPPSTTVLLRVCRHLRTFRGKVLLLAPWWPAQPWFGELQRWCPNPLMLGNACLVNNLPPRLQTTLRLHAWSFCVVP